MRQTRRSTICSRNLPNAENLDGSCEGKALGANSSLRSTFWKRGPDAIRKVTGNSPNGDEEEEEEEGEEDVEVARSISTSWRRRL